jgi:hypothetical protein
MVGTTGWVRLTLDAAGGGLYVGYADSRGRRVRPVPDPAWSPRGSAWVVIPPPPGASTPPVHWPARATRPLHDMVARLPIVRPALMDREAGLTSLAVLVRGPVPQVVPWVLAAVGLSEKRFVVATEARRGAHPPFALPFDVVVTTPDQDELRAAVERLLSGLAPGDRASAIRLRPAYGNDEPADILVTSTPELPPLLGTARRARPRLVVLNDRGGLLGPATLPAGTSLVALGPGSPVGPAAFAGRLLREFTHDLPLHEAVRAAAAGLGLTPEQQAAIRLHTTPAGLDALRLATAVDDFQRRTRDLPRYRSVGGIEGGVFFPRRPEVAFSRSESAPFSRLEHAAIAAQLVRDEFLRESSGFSDLARAEAAWTAAQPERRDIDAAGAALLGEPAVADPLVAAQDRRTAIWLTHDLTAPVVNRIWTLDRAVVLGQGHSYVLNVGIGIDWPTNLVDPDTPSIDPILPPTSAPEHVLDVAVYSGTTHVLDAPARPLALPRIGPSEVLQFRLRMPDTGDTTLIRVHLYFRGHILQAYELNLALGSAETLGAGPAMRADLVYSRRQQLHRLDRIPPRLLSVATNEDTDGTHRLMFGTTGGAVRLSEATVGASRAYLRERMAQSLAGLDPAGRLAPEAFERQVKMLAQSGKALWGRLFDNQRDPVQQKLDEVSRAASGTLQVLRLEPDFAFPWSMLYDWPLPATSAEVDAATVCRGDQCSCGPGTRGICVRGFWGVRLVVEELVRQDDADDYVDTVAGAAGSPVVVCTVGVPGDQWAMRMVGALTGGLGPARCEDLAADKSLLVRMWDPARRPAVLVVVGHLTNTPVDDEPRRPRIYVRASERFLDTEALRDAKRANGTRRWDAPHRPIVLLLGCDTGRSGLGEVHSFVASLSSAGAAAIIATEEKIDTRLAGDLAGHMVPALGDVGTGEALRRWRARLMADGNPLGLVFTCFGSAGAVVPELI